MSKPGAIPGMSTAETDKTRGEGRGVIDSNPKNVNGMPFSTNFVPLMKFKNLDCLLSDHFKCISSPVESFMLTLVQF